MNMTFSQQEQDVSSLKLLVFFWFFFGFFFRQALSQSSSTFRAMLYLDLSWGNSVNMEYLCTVANSIRDFSASNTLSFDQPVYR